MLVPGYEILGDPLGIGGMGVVYKAWQIKAKRYVALKTLRSGKQADPEEIARFRTEAEAVARLQHPNIVQIHEVGEHDGLHFFSMEYCVGGSLDKKPGGLPLPPREAGTLVETLARAMHAAHGKRVVHRDLKPANVLLAEDGGAEISDFGLAKKLEIEQGQTLPGVIMGSPPYMAPEQASGKSKEVGPATDVYALGAILYECLTGRPPFKGPNAFDTLRAGADGGSRPGAPASAQDAVRPGDNLPELPPERAVQALCDRGGTGGGSAAFRDGRTDHEAAGGGGGAVGEVGPAQSGSGGTGVRRRRDASSRNGGLHGVRRPGERQRAGGKSKGRR